MSIILLLVHLYGRLLVTDKFDSEIYLKIEVSLHIMSQVFLL